ncbi:ASCH domain-containing protein [Hymenobacter chitinivorans]|uniref:ASCH domain-containing protein n=1 Tax=Hymenobacter chitinivorans DSM 11115 TaxID=1121954 RepID=A0A2M9BR32_9BACT|nr:hypothetical protein [Hymenobacter chitinivorans]PJJ60362.1 hypothetical protein CLV45_1787 [Hymenobacter chitinivorans DSM 11115]
MLAAVRATRKTVTRRRIVAFSDLNEHPEHFRFLGLHHDRALFEPTSPGTHPRAVEPVVCPFGHPGTRLQVLEDPEIMLEVLSVRAEQVQQITEAGAQAEGVIAERGESARQAFCALITSIYPLVWVRNEWVWVVEFRRVQ